MNAVWQPYPSYTDRLGPCVDSLCHPIHPIDFCFATISILYRCAWPPHPSYTGRLGSCRRLPWPPYPCYAGRLGSCTDCLGHPIHPLDLGVATLSILYRCAWPSHPSYTGRLGSCTECSGHPIHHIAIGFAPEKNALATLSIPLGLGANAPPLALRWSRSQLR